MQRTPNMTDSLLAAMADFRREMQEASNRLMAEMADVIGEKTEKGIKPRATDCR